MIILRRELGEKDEDRCAWTIRRSVKEPHRSSFRRVQRTEKEIPEDRSTEGGETKSQVKCL